MEFDGHAFPLRAVPGEEEDRVPVGVGDAAYDGRVGCALGEGGQAAQEPVQVVGDDDGPVFQGGPGGGQGPGQVGGAGRGVRGGPQMGGEAGGLRAQGGGGAAGDGEGAGGGGVVGRRPRIVVGGRFGGLFEDDVGVGAADPERRDGGPARPVGGGPVAGLGEQFDVSRAPVDVFSWAYRRAGWLSSRPARSARTVLMTPATPAAAWVWPMLDFTEPSSSGRSAGRSWP